VRDYLEKFLADDRVIEIKPDAQRHENVKRAALTNVTLWLSPSLSLYYIYIYIY
jgi:hypothetical protein